MQDRHDVTTYESEIGLEVLGNFSDQSLEGKLSDQELSRSGQHISQWLKVECK
jgi:hypothetical protein